MCCFMILSEVLPSLFLTSSLVYWLYLSHYAWNMEYKIRNSQILLTLFMEGPTTFRGSGKMLHKNKEPQCCVWPFWHSCWVCSVNTHFPPPTHMALPSDFFAPPDGKEIGMWRHLALLSTAFVYALCTFMMERCPVSPKLSERHENFNRWKACK